MVKGYNCTRHDLDKSLTRIANLAMDFSNFMKIRLFNHDDKWAS